MQKKPKLPMPIEQIDDMIQTIRGTRVMLIATWRKFMVFQPRFSTRL
jgi:hypothetical protein